MLLIILVAILILFIGAFVFFLLYELRMNAETFNKLCQRKVTRISKRHKLNSIANLNISNYNNEKLGVNHVIFGKKYIYLLSDIMLKGFVSGEVNDNSWLYFNNIKRTTHYVSNLNMVCNKNIQEFAGILGIKEDLIVSICIVPNECDFKVKGLEKEGKFVVHFSSLNRKIKNLEQQDINSLDESQTYEQFKTIERINETR
jgi:hypothetical protein